MNSIEQSKWRVDQIVEGREVPFHQPKITAINYVSKGTELDVVSAVADILNDKNNNVFYNTIEIKIKRVDVSDEDALQ